jgi:hypothetical protein
MPKKTKTDRKLETNEGLVEVTSTVSGLTNRKATKLKIRPFATNTANVGCNLGYSFEQKNGSWAKIGISIHIPCYVEELSDMSEEVISVADKLMDRAIEKLGEDEDGE